MESTITENDMDAASQQFVQGFRDGQESSAPDLDVDGLSDSVLARLMRLFGRD